MSSTLSPCSLLPVPSTSGTQFGETSVRERMREKLKAVRIGDHLLSAVQRKEGKVSARVKFRDVVRRGKQKS
ncbi:Coiled-coil and C2 domain-containing protein 2A, partial [Ophiophagus hannah]